MTHHTPEPWFHHAPSGSEHAMGGYINASEERGGAAIVHVCGSRFSEDEYRANARRIVACVNACVGVGNGELAMTTMSAVLARMKEAEQQRNDLRDAIGLAITIAGELVQDKNLPCHMKSALNELAEGLRVRATITKTTGETK